jgi:molecular chaperone GrpE (heat shock protein)
MSDEFDDDSFDDFFQGQEVGPIGDEEKFDDEWHEENDPGWGPD